MVVLVIAVGRSVQVWLEETWPGKRRGRACGKKGCDDGLLSPVVGDERRWRWRETRVGDGDLMTSLLAGRCFLIPAGQGMFSTRGHGGVCCFSALYEAGTSKASPKRGGFSDTKNEKASKDAAQGARLRPLPGL